MGTQLNHYKYLLVVSDLESRAWEYAKQQHFNQTRKYQPNVPYIVHLEKVHKLLCEANADFATRVAGILHDVLEDTDSTSEEIIALFGSDVWQLVDQVTRKKNGKFNIVSRGALMVKLADMLDNVSDAPEEYVRRKLDLVKDW